MALHVDVHLRLVGTGQPPQGPESGKHSLGGAARVDGVELAVEGRQFQRHVHPWQRPVRSFIDERIGGPRRGVAGQLREKSCVGVGIGVCLRLACDRLTEEVECEATMSAALDERRPGRLRWI